MRTFLLLTAWLLLSLSACGGGGGGGDGGNGGEPDPDPEPEILFEDTFDGEYPGGNWIIPGPGGAIVDVDGEPALELGNIEITASAPPFQRDGKMLQFFMFFAWPEGCPAGVPGTNLAIQVVDADTDIVVASMQIEISEDCNTIYERYVIHPDGASSANSIDETADWIPADFGYEFHDYGFVIEEDGTAFWSVDEEVLVETTVPFTPANLKLRLGGQGEPSLDPVLFDDIVVQRQ